MTPDDAADRLHDLLAAEATQGLTAVEKDELDRLLSADRDDLALAAAAADRAFGLRPTPLPATLQAKLEQAAAAFRPAAPATLPLPPRKPGRRALWARSGWAVAAGVGLVFVGSLAVPPKPHPDHLPAETVLADLKGDPATRAYHPSGPGAVTAGLVRAGQSATDLRSDFARSLTAWSLACLEIRSCAVTIPSLA